MTAKTKYFENADLEAVLKCRPSQEQMGMQVCNRQIEVTKEIERWQKR